MSDCPVAEISVSVNRLIVNCAHSNVLLSDKVTDLVLIAVWYKKLVGKKTVNQNLYCFSCAESVS